MRRRFIYQDEPSNKFWDIEITGSQFTVYFGKAGTQGQTQTKEYTSEEECKKAAEKLIAEKTRKGYTQVTEETNAEPAGFAPPHHLYNDLLAVAGYLEQNSPQEREIAAVTEENIEEMESAAGFPMPEIFVDFWLEKGSLFFSKDDFICTVYAFNAEGQNANNLYGFLTFYQNFYRCKFELLETEKGFFSSGCWVLGMIIDGDEMRIFVADPLGTVHTVHFAQSLKQTNDEAFLLALSPLLEAKGTLRSVMGAAAFEALSQNNEAALENGAETEGNEEEETRSFLEKHGIKAVSYEEVLALLNIENLFDYWDDEDADNPYAGNYESEREYFEDHSSIYYCDGDLHIEGTLEIPHVNINLLVVNGSMVIYGKIASSYGGVTPYYVTGNTTVDFIDLGYLQKTIGTETIRYVASAWGQDDEAVHTMPSRSINAPYFFSWFYDLACFEFSPQTLITALYNYDELSQYETDNAFLLWHDYAYAFHPDFCYLVEESHYDVLNVSPQRIYEALKNNREVLIKGVTPEGIKLTHAGMRLKKEGDAAGAYQYFKEAFTKAPGYYPAYFNAGKCLFEQKAYGQAKEIFAKGIPLTPERLSYECDCMEEAALCAVRTGEYDKAIEWAKIALQKNGAAYFALRVSGEALICQNKLDEAKGYLERSIEIKSIFTNNWLLGLIYHLQVDKKKADNFYKAAASHSDKAQPYAEHTSLHYIYGDPLTVDWDTQRPVQKVKDQAYWDQYFADMLGKYGPDMYRKTGKFPLEWLTGKLLAIPEQYRTKDMLQQLLDHQTKGAYDVSGQVIQCFTPGLYTAEIILLAVNREEPCYYKDIPAAFLSEQIYQVHPHGIDLSCVPKDQLSYELCFRAVSSHQYNYNYVPPAFKDERMNIALIAGGNLQDTHCKDLPSRYYTNEYIKQAIDLGMHVIKNIPARLVNKDVFEYAAGKYSQEPEWPFIVEQYDRQRWRWGSGSDVASMGKAVRNYGIDIFDHVDVERINLHSYGYYKKHLGHLPEFSEKAAAFGWNERRKITDEYLAEAEFDYDTFSKVWACFWDEAFIIKALTVNKPGSGERIYHVPPEYLTQQICEIAVAGNSYDFQFVPKHLVTPQMCETACSLDYGAALEYVPLPLRNAKVCELALSRDTANIRFIPLALRTIAFCTAAILKDSSLNKYVPHEHYEETYETLFARFRNRFSPDYLLLNWGLGLLLNKKYEKGRTKLSEVENAANARSSYWHQAVYYTGWSYFLEGNTDKAGEYWRTSQDIAKSQKIEDEYWLTYPYAAFQVPVVPSVYEMSQEEFDGRMREATLLVQDKSYAEAIDILFLAEKQLRDAQCSEMRLWAYVWDHQRYALYEAGRKDESLALCRSIITELEKLTLWDYLEEFNPIRAAIRSAHNSLAYYCYETATDLNTLVEGIQHIKTTMKTIAPIEDKTVLNPFYETQALLLHKATSFDAGYQKDFEKVIAKIKKLKLQENGILSDELLHIL